MKTIHVNTGKPYDIYIQRGILKNCGEYAKRLTSCKKVFTVSDSNVAPLYLKDIEDSLKASGFECSSFIYKAGEESKNLDTVKRIYDELASFNMTRKDIIIALGGGVCGDMAGFAAATYLRGIDFIQIPTSLLSQVDSSVGGKTAVDLKSGKNLVGAFHQPVAVLIDPDTLNTLDDRFFTDGMGEVIKYGCIKDKDFFTFLEKSDIRENIEYIIERCVSIKREVVSIDEFDKGERMLLNYGHTLGHSIEKLHDFSGITHGMAVAIGMVMMAKAGEKNHITEEGTSQKIKSLCEKFSLPVSTAFSYSQIASSAMSDKKSEDDQINLVLLSEIGKSFTKKIKKDDLEGFISV